MRCNNCGKKLTANTRFCLYCGNDVLQNTPSNSDNHHHSKVSLHDKKKKKAIAIIAGFYGSYILVIVLCVAVLFATSFSIAFLFDNSEDDSVNSSVIIPSEPVEEKAGGTDGGNSDIVEYNGHYYFIFPGDTVSDYQSAIQYCTSQGGYLANISSQEENDFLYSHMVNLGYVGAYFGYSDADSEGDWNWVNGEASSYQNWNPDEPNGETDDEDYAMFYEKYNDGTWNDGNFISSEHTSENAFICEWDGNPLTMDNDKDNDNTDTNDSGVNFYTDNEQTYFVNIHDDSGIYVRSGPDKSYPDILYIKKNDKSVRLLYMNYSVQGEDGYYWHQVQIPNGDLGYVREDVVMEY